VKLGAFDFLEKPFTPEKLMITLARCLELRSVKDEVNTLKAQVEGVAVLGTSVAKISFRICRLPF
jgi:DNA-binding NtrC family response regulator